MTSEDTNRAQTLALDALAWTLAEDARAERFLALTGLDADSLRNRVTDPQLLAAVIGFLEAHEPDLIACAASMNVSPLELLAVPAKLAS